MASQALLAHAREQYAIVRLIAGLLDPTFNDRLGMLWYYAGLYEAYGFDEDGRSYRVIEDDESDDIEAALTGERMAASDSKRLYNTWG